MLAVTSDIWHPHTRHGLGLGFVYGCCRLIYYRQYHSFYDKSQIVSLDRNVLLSCEKRKNVSNEKNSFGL